MEVLRLADLQEWCADYESTLRSSFGVERRLPDHWEAALAQHTADTLLGAIARWGLLKHYHYVRQEQRARKPVDSVEAQEAARQLLRREPVRVEIAGHVVGVTARSYACMAEVARHDRRIRLLSADQVHVERQLRVLADALAAGSTRHRWRLRKLAAVADRIDQELLRQRRALWAHALTSSGAPARDLEQLPTWWNEIDPIWDAALLMALMQAGAGRYAKLGDPPEVSRKGRDPEDEFGWATLFSSIERQQKLEPSALYDRDLYQLLAWMRAGADPVPEEFGG